MGYSFRGYSILRGYPLAAGHDPGFAQPIFIADYSTLKKSADCRYIIPKGMAIASDVSCMTAFSSKVIKSARELKKSLSVSAYVKASGWGVQFSASAGYKKASKEVSSGQYVYILSSASCTYYFATLQELKPPPFDEVFIEWVKKLDQGKNDSGIYFEFFNVYGTHYVKEITYGAHYTYQHRMQASTFATERRNGVNVAVQASYSGLFSIGGGMKLDSSQQQAAFDFRKSVETKTITVGAPPPANGDAMTWASNVKDSPLPIKYSLKSIEHLFTSEYMAGLGVNFTTIYNMIKENKQEYCKDMRLKGKVDSCL